MVKLIYVCLLIIYGVLAQENDNSSFITENVGESSHHLIRRKRVINLESGGDVPLENGDAPFVANIRRSGFALRCVGAILSKHTVITISDCVNNFDESSIKVLVGSSHSYFGFQHNVIRKNTHIDYHERITSISVGIALLTVEPAIVFGLLCAPIQLYQGSLQPGTNATIFGWGYNPTAPHGTNYRIKLRSITLPIMNHTECVNSYRARFVLSDSDICTYHPNKKTGHTDLGAPLVVNNKLAGLHIFRTETPGRISPDVFLALQSVEYTFWIRNNIVHNLYHTHG